MPTLDVSARLATAPPLFMALALLALTAPWTQTPLPPQRTATAAEGPRDPAPPISEPVRLARVALPPPPAQNAVAAPTRPASLDRPSPSRGVAALAPPPEPIPQAPRLVAAAADRTAGQAILRAIDSGKGPSIILGWPAAPSDRRSIAAYLTRCAGLTVALLADGRLWRLEEPRGQAWVPGPADMSPVARQAETMGRSSAARIRAHHGLDGGAPVALVDRRFDAQLLGGLSRLAGPVGFSAGADVRVRYSVDDRRLLVEGLQVSGRAVPGSLDLGWVARCG